MKFRNILPLGLAMVSVCWTSCSGGSGNADVCTQGEIELDNGHITLRQDLGRGGSICYISLSGEDRNIVNVYDDGRLIQQSYYAGNPLNRQDEGQSSAWSPWRWNPIQGGNYAGSGARVLHVERTDTSTYVKCVPMLWDMNGHEAEAIMEQWTSIDGNVVHVRNKLTCNRTDTIYGEGIATQQEIPAVYPISKLKKLYVYIGEEPFTGAELTTPAIVRLQDNMCWGSYPSVPEKWMAFVDDNLWGLGVYTPSAESFWAGRYGGPDGEASSISTSYIAPVCTTALAKSSVMEYDYYLIVGDLDAIRSTVYNLNKQIDK